jgi:VPDSG-CTERM motif
MKNRTKTILGGLAIGFISCALFSQQAQAVPITGEIRFAGNVQLDSTHLDLATTVVTWFDGFNTPGMATVLPGASDDFSGILFPTSATMHNGWVFITPTPGLWSVGGFTFDLMSAVVTSQSANFLNVLGTGIISANGFDPTPATWSFTIDNADGRPHLTFGFATDTVAGVPDGGSAVALLGLALIGIEGLRRKLRVREG